MYLSVVGGVININYNQIGFYASYICSYFWWCCNLLVLYLLSTVTFSVQHYIGIRLFRNDWLDCGLWKYKL